MHVVEQKLVVRDWPLIKTGHRKFFGYVVGMGVLPREWCEGGMISYVDFAYNDDYVRYRLPDDSELIKHLSVVLWGNIADGGEVGSLMGKVWIKRTEQGHAVELP